MDVNTKPTQPTKPKREQREHYVNNKEFAAAVTEHVRGVKQDTLESVEPRQISDYIAQCFLKIATGLSRRENFMNYSYREDMVMDAVENCVLRVNNFDADKPTRTGKPNPFSYFTQICYFAFLRRIAIEKKQADIKQRVIDNSAIDAFAEFDGDESQSGETMVDRLRQRNNQYFNDPTKETAEVKKKERKKRAISSNTATLW
jgi:hypothetical protein